MKIWKLLIPLSIIILFIYMFLSGINEGFEMPNIIFKSKEDIQLFIINDKDEYIKNMTIYDLRARKVKTRE